MLAFELEELVAGNDMAGLEIVGTETEALALAAAALACKACAASGNFFSHEGSSASDAVLPNLSSSMAAFG